MIEAERFDKDYAVYEKKNREDEYEKKLNKIENARVKNFERDNERWGKMDNEELKQESRLQERKDKYCVGKRNQSGAAFNPITLEYETNTEGTILKNKDDQAKVKLNY